ncbi:hypothetical protein BU25DRAFT_155358 [Macroventuria anomochaeta]|uniref:Uncharacterized protein n=1 Tax=Macroventuria anomochaeta TaxID=301207 RepID=A0ACB6RS01_9PLEO|nr:uncharacterized protein BU25DRAFT_155358 [Macroventuria anomochaeta]KAF2624559.1 hypothetical protein BU25DRAFT_155358 [Macroventuria anomochaeta]
MRVMSAVTLVFLPGTFFATMSRTSFWTFDLSTTGPVVSRWVCLYWFLTTVLTVFVLAIWRNFLLVKQSRKKMSKTWEHASAAWTAKPLVGRLQQQHHKLSEHSKPASGQTNGKSKAAPPKPQKTSNWRTIKRKTWFRRQRAKDGCAVGVTKVEGLLTGMV